MNRWKNKDRENFHQNPQFVPGRGKRKLIHSLMGDQPDLIYSIRVQGNQTKARKRSGGKEKASVCCDGCTRQMDADFGKELESSHL